MTHARAGKNVSGMVDEQPSSVPRGAPRASAFGFIRRRVVISQVSVVILGVALTCALLLTLRGTKISVRQVQCQEETKGRWSVKEGHNRTFKFSGFGDRVFAPNAPEFNFGASQDFSIEAWIKAYPAASKSAQRVTGWVNAHPMVSRFVPKKLAVWIAARAADNDFGVMPIVDKHQTRSTVECVGFQFYLDHGRVACQLSAPPMRPLGFQNFVSPAPNLHDGRWHHVAVTVERNSAKGGKLYVDGQSVLTFDPTNQAGDLSNTEPLRIGNHANPSLKCFFEGTIGGVTLDHRALSAHEIAVSYRRGRPSR